MRLAAIYVEKHEYLFNKPQTINFGGRYFYQFNKEKNNIVVTRVLNEKFIPDFFNLVNTECKITNINAVVGQNGAGKSTLLDIIRSSFVQNEYALPQSQTVFLIEDENNNEPLILRNDFEYIYFKNENHTNTRRLNKRLTRDIQTIYYSPHYDYKFNPNFDEVDNHDISFDKIVENDLKELGIKDTKDNGFPYSASQELIFKNSLRQIQFLSSDLVNKQNIFKNLFKFQKHYEPILYFRGFNQREKEWNTPDQLRQILQLIDKKAEKESSEWHIYRDEGANQTQIHQYLLKRNVLKCILTVLYHQFEQKNTFLQEGYFPYEELNDKLKTSDAYQTLLLLVEHSKIQLKSSKPKKIFKKNNLPVLLSKIYAAIDKVTTEDSISNSTLKVSSEDAIEILHLQRKFLHEVGSYYTLFYKDEKERMKESDKIDEFINYMPFSRKMSSGENSLLNFFSRIYDFLDSNLKDFKFMELSDHYILLLDEADLTFHLSWKKKYVQAILKTIPYFFNELDTKPSVEIIFTTHDPLTLSDLPNTNVIYIERSGYDSSPQILDYNNERRPLKTFGANISDLIADSFFIADSLIGDFATDKIQETIKWLNAKDNLENKHLYKQIIANIDEPIIQRKLAEMFDDKTNGNLQLEVINNQIARLQEFKKRIKQ